MHGSSHSEDLYVLRTPSLSVCTSAETDAASLYGIDQGNWYRVFHRTDYPEAHMLDKGF